MDASVSLEQAIRRATALAVDERREVQAWKARTGGKVLGFFCSYLPEELCYAANVLPVRIVARPGGAMDRSDRHIYGMFCAVCRGALSAGLAGDYDFLDGIAIGQSCLHMRQAFGSWSQHLAPEFSYYLPMPNRVRSPHAVRFLHAELVRLVSALQTWTGVALDAERLAEGILVVNQTRTLLETIFRARRRSPPPMSGTQALALARAAQLCDKRALNPLLEAVVHGLDAEPPGDATSSRPRLLVTGSTVDDLALIQLIEQLGADVVTDDLCSGTRYFTTLVDPAQSDPLLAIAERYCQKPPCPSKDWLTGERADRIRLLAHSYGCDGAILTQQKFCDPQELDLPGLERALATIGVKTLHLELDGNGHGGHYQVRVQAFVEMLTSIDLFDDALLADEL